MPRSNEIREIWLLRARPTTNERQALGDTSETHEKDNESWVPLHSWPIRVAAPAAEPAEPQEIDPGCWRQSLYALVSFSKPYLFRSPTVHNWGEGRGCMDSISMDFNTSIH